MKTTLPNRPLSRRDFLRASAGLMGMAALAACAPGVAPAAGGGSAAAPAAAAIEISFMGWGATEEDEGVKAAIKQFESEQDKIKVTWLHTPENYAQKFLANIAAGTPSDTAFVGSGEYQTYIRNNVLLDITDKITSDPLVGAADYFIEPQETERCTVDGKWFGIGSCWVAPHIYYNADIFQQANIEPPTNNPEEAWEWDKFVEVAKQLTVDAAGNHPDDAGFDKDNIAQWGVQWPTAGTALNAAILGNGGNWIDGNTGLLGLDQPEAIQAIQNVADLNLVHHVMPEIAAMEALGMTNTQMLENGKLAMAIDGSWALSWMYKINATLGTAVLPKMTTVATEMQAHIHSAMAASKYPEEAWQWVRFLSTPFYQTQFCKMGLWLPSQKALMTEDGLKEWITEGTHPTDYVKIATEYLPKYGHVLYQPVGWPEAAQIITPVLQEIWVGDATADQVLGAATAEANAKLQEAQG